MRLIGTLDDEQKGIQFSQFLHQQGILHHIDKQTNKDWGSHAYGTSHCDVWIQEEDDFEKVAKWFDLFVEDPYNPLFNTGSPNSAELKLSPPLFQEAHAASPSPVAKQKSMDNLPMGMITKSILAICTLLFFLSQLWTPNLHLPERYSGLILFTSPVEKALLYDYPHYYGLIDRFLRLYGVEELEHPSDLSPQGNRLLQQINQTPFWPGYYHLLLKEGWKGVEEGFSKYPTFEKIKEGEWWRLATPCLLHGDIIHLLFNMLWLILLGKQIEQKLRPFRYILLILIIGIFSNTAQYLMSGPNFIGFSGVLCGMLGFIWIRQKDAPWEGYRIDRLTILFMLVYVLIMTAIQFLSFFVEKSLEWGISPNIANMAHLSGGVMGCILGKFNFFGWKHA